MVLEFLSNGEALDCLSQHNLPKLSKITVSCPESVKGNKSSKVNSDLPKVSEVNINSELLKGSKRTSLKIYIFSHGEARNIKFGLQVNIIERVPLGGSDGISS